MKVKIDDNLPDYIHVGASKKELYSGLFVLGSCITWICSHIL